MPVRCQDCNSHFLLDATSVANGVSCPDCNGTRLERDQPSPTRSDGELRNMVDPATQIDAGGNPLQEGIWAGVDGGWQPAYKRDEFFAKTAVNRVEHPEMVCAHCKQSGGVGLYPVENKVQCRRCGFVGNIGADMDLAQRLEVEGFRDHPYDFETPGIPDHLGPVHQGRVAGKIPPPSGIEPQHHQVVQPGANGLHYRNLTWLAFLDASINGKPVREHYDELAVRHGINREGPDFGKPVTLSVHDPAHLPAAVEVAESDNLTDSRESVMVHAPTMHALGKAIFAGQAPAPPGVNVRPQPQAPPVMSNHYSRSTSMEPYLPWYHQADVTRYPADQSPPTTLTNEEWAGDKRQKYLDRQNVGHRLNWQPGTQGRGIMIGSSLHTWPIHKTPEDPQGGLMHGEYVRSLGVNAANLDPTSGFEIDPDGSMVGGKIPPEAAQIDPNLHEVEGGFEQMFGKTAVAPLVAIGGRMLLSQALGGLMRKAIHGAGNFLDTGQPTDPNAYGRPVSLVASEHIGVGHSAPVETPHSTPDLIEDHDPEAVDQQEFNDGDMNPAFNNPNLDVGDGGLSQGTGEDATKQKLEFRHDGDAVQHAEMLLPLILEFVNSEKSGLDNPQIKALHEALEAEIPGYLDHADEDDEAVHKLLEELKKPEHVHAMTREAIVPGAPMAQGQMGQMPMPGTHANPVQQGGMPVNGKCMNCGGVVNADGSCPQCGAAAGANQQGNLQAPGMQAPLGIMPSPYAKTAGEIESVKCGDCGETFRADLDEYTSCPNCHSEKLTVTAADHQGPITPQQKEVFAQYLIDQGRNNEVAAMIANPGLYADEWAQYLNRSTQPPEVDPAEQAPMPQIPPEQMGQMPVPGMNIPQPTAKTAVTFGEMGRQLTQVPHACRGCGYRTVVNGQRCPRCGASSDQNVPSNLDMRDPKAKTAADNIARRCPECQSATTSVMNNDGDCRCHRCGNIWTNDDAIKEKPDFTSNWKIVAITDPIQPNQSPANPVAAPAADATAPGDREQQQDSTLTWQATDGTPLQVGQTYEMHNPGYAIPDIVKIQAVKPDSITVTMEGEYNSPSDPQDANGPGYTHEIDRQELQTEGLTFNPMQGEGDAEQSQDQGQQDGIGQTVNTEPTRQSPEVPVHANFVRMAPMSEYDQYFGGESGSAAKAKSSMIEQYGEKKGEEVFYATVNKKKGAVETEQPTDHCPKCDYGHVTSSYTSPETVRYECYRCAHAWEIEDPDEGSELAPDTRLWLREDSSADDEIGFDPRALAMASAGQGRNIRDIAKRDPRHADLRERLNANKTAGAKFSPREQKEFIDEDGVARNSDRLNLDGTHYITSGKDISKARPDRVNDNYLGLGL